MRPPTATATAVHPAPATTRTTTRTSIWTRRMLLPLLALLLLVTACTPGTEATQTATDAATETATQATQATTASAAPFLPGPGDAPAAPTPPNPTDTDEGELAQPLPRPPGTPDPADPDFEIPAGAQRAVVTWIIDGDTIDVEPLEPGDVPPGDQRIRLLEIDTPERDDDCYETATDLLADLIPVGSEVFLERDTEDTDPNGRYLRYVWSADVGLVNVIMVEEGLATEFVFPLNRLHEAEVIAAEERAQEFGLGLWGSYCDGRP